MALSENVQLEWSPSDRGDLSLTNQHVYEGSALEFNSSGDVQKCSASGNPFAGHSLEEVDNSAGSAGDKDVQVRRGEHGNGYMAKVTVDGGVSDGDEGTVLYASDDDTYTKTEGTTNCRVGTIYKVLDASANLALVHFEPVQ